MSFYTPQPFDPETTRYREEFDQLLSKYPDFIDRLEIICEAKMVKFGEDRQTSYNTWANLGDYGLSSFGENQQPRGRLEVWLETSVERMLNMCNMGEAHAEQSGKSWKR